MFRQLVAYVSKLLVIYRPSVELKNPFIIANFKDGSTLASIKVLDVHGFNDGFRESVLEDPLRTCIRSRYAGLTRRVDLRYRQERSCSWVLYERLVVAKYLLCHRFKSKGNNSYNRSNRSDK